MEQVPCGKCPKCSSRRVSSWSFRLLQEMKISDSARFITLTYDDKHLVRTRMTDAPTIRKKEVQDFMKRLRKAQDKKYPGQKPIKYFAVGEYGGDTERPHYHIIMFNHKLELIQTAWNKGHVHYDPVNEATIGYTLKYISKRSKVPYGEWDEREPTFALMSKGLGLSYITPEMITWHKADLLNRMYCNIPDGKKIGMPRYYKKKIYDETEEQLAGHHTRQKMLIEQGKEMEKIGRDKYLDDQDSAKYAAFKKQQFKNRKKDKL